MSDINISYEYHIMQTSEVDNSHHRFCSHQTETGKLKIFTHHEIKKKILSTFSNNKLVHEL